jgi:hypothetical protein
MLSPEAAVVRKIDLFQHERVRVGSPGASITPTNLDILNFARINDPVPIISGEPNHVAGSLK